MEKMELYESVRSVPECAKRDIQAGRLKGKTDINPMWRIKVLTELFGPCGFGWKYCIKREWTEAGSKGEVAAFVDIDLYVKVDGEWSEPIPGTGGSMFIASERNGPYTSDECFKMALTDAISVSCKALGVGADVYWSADRTKYTGQENREAKQITCEMCGGAITAMLNNGRRYAPDEIATNTKQSYGKQLCWTCARKMSEGHNEEPS